MHLWSIDDTKHFGFWGKQINEEVVSTTFSALSSPSLVIRGPLPSRCGEGALHIGGRTREGQRDRGVSFWLWYFLNNFNSKIIGQSGDSLPQTPSQVYDHISSAHRPYCLGAAMRFHETQSPSFSGSPSNFLLFCIPSFFSQRSSLCSKSLNTSPVFFLMLL